MDKVTRQCPQTTTFLKRKESRSGIEPRSLPLTSLTPYRWAKPAHLGPLLPVVLFIRGALYSLFVLVYRLFLSVLDAESTVVDLLCVSLSTTCYPCCFREASKWDCTHPIPTHTSQQPANGTVHIPLPPTLHSSQQMGLYPSHSHPQFAAASKWDSVHIPFPPTLCSSQQMELCTHPAPTLFGVQVCEKGIKVTSVHLSAHKFYRLGQ